MPTVPSLTPTFRMPYVDPDEASPFLEVPKAREFEARVNATNALVAKVVRSYDLADAFRGDLIDAMDSTTGRTTHLGTGTMVLSTDTAAGFSHDGTALKLACTTLQASTAAGARLLGFSAGTPVSYTDLSGLTTFLVSLRASTLTNLSHVRVLFYFSGSLTNWARFDIAAAGISVASAVSNHTLTRAAPTATGGVVNWAQVYGVEYQVLPTASAYSGNVWVDGLRFAWALGTTYKWRGRWLDNNAAGEWGPYPAAYRVLKVSANPTVGAGAAASTSDPSPTVAWTFAGSSGAAQAGATIQVYNGSGVLGSLLRTIEHTGTATSVDLPAGLIAQGQTWTARVTARDVDGLSSSVTLAAVGPMVLVKPHEPVATAYSTTYLRDQFTRAVTDGLGSLDTGGAWTIGGTAADFDVLATGLATIAAAANTGHSLKVAHTALEEDGYLEWSWDKVPTGQDVWVGPYLRFDNASTYYRLMVYLAAGGSHSASLTPVLAGVAQATLGSIPLGTYVAGTRMALRWLVTGASPTRLRVKAWVAGTPEPAAWQLDVSDSAAGLQDAPTHFQVNYQANAGILNGPVTLSLHRLLVIDAASARDASAWYRGDLAAAAVAGATNIKVQEVGAIRLGTKLLLGTGYTAETVVVVGPEDGLGNFSGTPGSGGTGVDLDRALVTAHSSGESLKEKVDLTVTYEEATSWATISWETTEVDASRFYAYHVERLEGAGVWRRIATLTDRTASEYVDEEAPVGQSTAWRVITDNGTLQSDPALADATLTPAGGTPFYWVIPGTTYAMPIRNVVNMGRRYPQDVDSYQTLGRTTTVEERGELLEPELTIQAVLLPNQAVDVVEALRYAARPSNAVPHGVLKDNQGKVYRGLPRDIQDPPSDRIPRARDLSFALAVTTT